MESREKRCVEITKSGVAGAGAHHLKLNVVVID